MATRQEQLTAFSVSKSAFYVGAWMWDLQHALQGLNAEGDSREKAVSEESTSLQTFSENRTTASGLKSSTKAICDKTNAVRAVTTQDALDTFTMKMSDITHDVTEPKTICNSVSIGLSASAGAMDALKTAFVAYTPKVVRRATREEMPVDNFYCNIYHDLLDAMSYTLQGVHHNTGELDNRPAAWIKSRVEGMLSSAGRIESYSSHSDMAQLESIVDYVGTEIGKISQISISAGNEYKAIGQYIDSNVPKLQMVRRWWSI